MPARSTRQKARARILSAFAAQLDRVIPEDESVPLKGATFADFEDQVETLAQAALPVALEERAALEFNAEVNYPRLKARVVYFVSLLFLGSFVSSRLCGSIPFSILAAWARSATWASSKKEQNKKIFKA